jgi:hypothetical protein
VLLARGVAGNEDPIILAGMEHQKSKSRDWLFVCLLIVPSLNIG